MLNLYETYYKLEGDPFRLTPDHRFSIRHRSYANAKSYLEYALFQGEGFVIVTGEPGTGKTTLVSEILAGFDKSRIRVATLNSTQLDTRDLLHMVAVLFGLDVQEVSKPALLLSLEKFLTQQIRRGHRSVLIVDEAQGLSQPALEELRLLANLQDGNRAVLQIALVGQEQLQDLISTPEMEHLRQRVIASTRLEPLGLEETVDYVEHRLCQVGWEGDPAISGEALQLVHRYSGGVPRRINLICNRLFLHGGLEGKHALEGSDARTVLDELQQERLISAEVLADTEAQEDLLVQGEAVNASGFNLPRAGMPARPRPASPSLPREERVDRGDDVIQFQHPAGVPADGSEAGMDAPAEYLAEEVAAELGFEEDWDREDGVAQELAPDSEDTRAPRGRKWAWAAAYSVLAMLIGAAVLIRLEGWEPVMARVSDVIERYTVATGTSTEQEAVVRRDAPDNGASRGDGEHAGFALPAGEQGAATPPGQKLPAPQLVQDEVVSEQAALAGTQVEPAPVQAGSVARQPGAGPAKTAPAAGQTVPTGQAVQQAGQQAGVVIGPLPEADQVSIDAEYTRLRSQAGQRLAELEGSQTSAVKKSASPKPPQGDQLSGSSRQRALPAAKRSAQLVAKTDGPKSATPKTTPPAETVYSPDKLKSVLLEGRWSSEGKPAAHLPSEITYCQAQGEGITCWSVPQYVSHPEGQALQKVETRLQNFSTVGSFRLTFRTLVKSPDAARAGYANPQSTPADQQWRVSEQVMVCRFSQLKSVLCRDVKGKTLHYQRLPSG